MKKTKGFTLIELLIVILLIGVLSGVLLGVINVGGIRAKSRDARRVADLKKVQNALELYFQDYRAYPATSWGAISAQLGVLETGEYINKLPTDPVPAGTAASPCVATTNYDYWYIGTAKDYVLATNMEVVSSATDAGPCSGLNNWTWADDTCTPITGNCYGVENPF